jgi:hypothetical protein
MAIRLEADFWPESLKVCAGGITSGLPVIQKQSGALAILLPKKRNQGY